ncbi:hypothetical protein RFI_25937 [Reticulomyxa filosa]|uniref:Uncharacterized protein n=1 Tax=Reticulomyxa filosa TaxID=46433 RepID=X6MC64_RETFI|nr:hypothetical protein RFI_25937 [Reticulomyxa filosa]|eukprot:ETO11439.1 hypothetical protein RFI_25937 [Reticulomyxa filosa]
MDDNSVLHETFCPYDDGKKDCQKQVDQIENFDINEKIIFQVVDNRIPPKVKDNIVIHNMMAHGCSGNEKHLAANDTELRPDREGGSWQIKVQQHKQKQQQSHSQELNR